MVFTQESSTIEITLAFFENKSYYYKDLNKDFLNEFADSLTLKTLDK